MGGGGGGSGYVAPGVMFGVTLTGDDRKPAENEDPDLSQTGRIRNDPRPRGPEFGPGADGLVVIYY